MQKLQLYIEGQRLDLFDDETVSLTQSIQNVRDIAKIFTDFSKTFTLPASKNNNKIFKHYYNYDIDNGFDARTKKDAIIELNNLPFTNGKIKLEGVGLKNNKPNTYRITFFGSTVTLKDLLGEDKLQALSDLDSISLIYDAVNLRSGLVANPLTNDVIVPLITHTKRLFYDSVSHVNGSGNLYYHTGGGTNLHGVDYNELKYALRIDRIIKAIETKYTISFSDDFFINTNAPYYNLFMWLHRKKGDVENLSGVNQSIVNGFTATLEPDDETQTQIVNSSTLRILGNPTYYLNVDLTITPSDGTNYRGVIYKNGVEVYKSNLTSGSLTITKNEIDLAQADYTIFIESDTDITFTSIAWSIDNKPPFEPISSISYTIAPYNFVSSFDFTITQQIPEIKVIDFLTGIFKMFNLTAYVENDIIVVKTLDAYYNSGSSYDISKYIDVTSSEVNVALPYREVSFFAEDTNTLLAKQHEQIAGKTWGKEEYKGDGSELDGALYSIKTPFSQLKYERLYNVSGGAPTSIQWGYFVDDNQESYYGKPLVFYPILQSGGNQISFLSNPTTNEPLINYNIPSNSLSISKSIKDNINFFAETNEYTGTNDFTDTLFKKYYEKYITSVFNLQNRLTKVTAYLPLRILLKYTLADRFVINNRSFKINSINTNLNTGKSVIELLNDL